MKTQKLTLSKLVHRINLGWCEKEIPEYNTGNERLILAASFWAVKVSGLGWETFIVCEHCWHDDDGNVFHYWEGRLGELFPAFDDSQSEEFEALQRAVAKRLERREGCASILTEKEQELLKGYKSFKYYAWDERKYEDEMQRARFDDEEFLSELLQILRNNG